MTTSDVISTIENATASLFQVLRTQEDTVNRLEATVKRLEDRIEWLESQLRSAREWGAEVSTQRDEAKAEVKHLTADIEAMKAEHQASVDRLHNVIRSIHSAVDSVVNPPYTPKPGEQPRDETGRFRPWSESNPEGYTSDHLNPEPLLPLLPEGVTAVPMDNPAEVHEAIREAVGEPKQEYPRAVNDPYRW